MAPPNHLHCFPLKVTGLKMKQFPISFVCQISHEVKQKGLSWTEQKQQHISTPDVYFSYVFLNKRKPATQVNAALV